MKKLLLYILIFTCFMGCTTFYSAVDRGTDTIFEDSILIFEKELDPLQVSFKLTNKTGNDMEILWDKCKYIDTSGNAFNVIHAGVKFRESGNIEVPSTIIAPGKTHSDFITPLDALKNKEQLHERKTEMYATHHQTTNQLYIVGENIDYTKKEELEGFIGREYKIHLVVLVGSKEFTYDLKGTITEIIDLLKD